jgi:hypothetical protein
MTAPARDLLSDRRTTILVYVVPTAAIVATSVGGVGEIVITIVWTLAFAVMGIACVVNVVRCGRVHCYFTGPFLLLVAAAALLHGLRVISLGPKGWEWLSVVAIAGTILLLTVPERLWGRYAVGARRDRG